MTDLHQETELQRGPNDRGVVLVLVALLLTALLITVALVIDFGQVRQTRQSSKSVADFAVTAGMRGLETPGVAFALPWGGVCTALEYLESNHPGLSGLTGIYKNEAGTTYGSNPCSNRSEAPYTTLCDPDNKATWAWFDGTANGGSTKIDIKSGYETGPGSGFPEDQDAYLGDDGDPAQKGCDQLAVIIGETDAAAFGGVVGATDYPTQIRSVGRVDIGEVGEEAVALLLLEQRQCGALVAQGNSTSILVRATPAASDGPPAVVPTRPGLIHVNSDASSGCSGGAVTIDSRKGCYAVAAANSEGGCSAPGMPSGPQIIAEATPTEPGVIASRAAATNPGSAFSTPACATHAPNADCVISPVPVNRGVITREPVDNRYLAHVRTLKSRATSELSHSSASAGAAGYATPDCSDLAGQTVISEAPGDDPVPAGTINVHPERKVFLDCNLTQSTTFGAGIDDVVVKGYVEVSGTLHLDNVRRFYVLGRSSGTQVGLDVTGTLFVNARGQTDTGSGATFRSACTNRFESFPRTEVTEVVVMNGSFNGGTATGAIHLCNSFMFLANDALPASSGTPPLTDNNHRGGIFIGSAAKLDWKAPNQTSEFVPAGSTLLAEFEDLALWSEYGRSTGPSAGIGGQGRVTTTGVFFMPNVEFNIGGGGFGVAVPADAQFIVRRLRLAGTTSMQIAPDPNNAVPTPKFEAFTLVR